MNFRAVVVDDEQLAREDLCFLLEQVGGIDVVGQAGNGLEALESIERLKPDVVFLDVQMPGLTGFEVARRVLDRQLNCHVVFVTAFDQYAIEAFEVNAVDYLLKPVRVPRLLAALQKVPRMQPLTPATLDELPAGARRYLSITERSRVILVPVEEVVYLKAELKYITIRTAQREFLLEESLTRLEEEFGARFVRVHRNCLVARDYIRGFERRVSDDGDAHWEVLLRDVPETLPVSRRQQSIVREFG